MSKTRIAIFASGAGSNADRLMGHFDSHSEAKVVLVASNNPVSGVVHKAWTWKVPCTIFTSNQLNNGSVLRELQSAEVDIIVLAGFLKLIPKEIIKAYPNKIINIHPSLLPKYGGQGMYGQRVHRAVIESKEKESGITIHYVNEQYDQGKHIAQFNCPVLENDTPEKLAERIHKLEHKHYPNVVEAIILQQKWIGQT